MTLIYPLISCLIFSVEIEIHNHDEEIVKISLDYFCRVITSSAQVIDCASVHVSYEDSLKEEPNE